VAKRQTSLNFRRQLLHKAWRRQGRTYGPGPGGLPSDEYICHTLHCDPTSLKRAAEFFRLNEGYRLDPTRESDVFLLALLLAEELFGKRRRGRKAGDKAWDEHRYLELGFLYKELKRECPRTSDSELAETIAADPAFKEYRNNPELIRQRLPQAKREWEKWALNYAEDWFLNSANREDDEDDDPASCADYNGL
jgi:hypothetical protein